MNTSSDNLLKQAQLLESKGQFGEAIKKYLRIVKLQPDNAIVYYALGHCYAREKSYQLSIEALEKVSVLKPKDPLPHFHLGRIFELQNNYLKALDHYRQALHAAPDFWLAHFHLGILLLKNQRIAGARKQFNNVLQLVNYHKDTHFYLGTLDLAENHLLAAEKHFQMVLADDPNDVEALTNLGVVALKNDQGQQAIDIFTKVLTIDDQHVEARNNIAATFIHYDRYENALVHYYLLLKDDPANLEYLYNAGVAEMALGRVQEAIGRFETILKQTPDHFHALHNLGAIYIRLNDKHKAYHYLSKAGQLKPEDPATSHMLNALTQANKAKTYPEYATNLFNNYALYYDQHMTEQLHYTLPYEIGRLIHQLHLLNAKEVLDLGCGTGLTGVVLKEVSQQLTGVDIAKKMLARAKEKGIYDHLIESELILFLENDPHTYDLAVAADVLPYFGDLKELFALLSQRLTPGGYFIFSTEMNKNRAWQLEPTGRFSHQNEYILALCKQLGLHKIHQENIIARYQEGKAPEIELFAVQKLSS